MVIWFSPNRGTEFSDIGTVFQHYFMAEFEDCFMAEFIAINYRLEIC